VPRFFVFFCLQKRKEETPLHLNEPALLSSAVKLEIHGMVVAVFTFHWFLLWLFVLNPFRIPCCKKRFAILFNSADSNNLLPIGCVEFQIPAPLTPDSPSDFAFNISLKGKLNFDLNRLIFIIQNHPAYGHLPLMAGEIAPITHCTKRQPLHFKFTNPVVAYFRCKQLMVTTKLAQSVLPSFFKEGCP
jgi:hypothetical protein